MAAAANAAKPNVMRNDRAFGLVRSSAGAGALPEAVRGRFWAFFGGFSRLRANVVPLGRKCQEAAVRENTDCTLVALPDPGTSGLGLLESGSVG
jgi:hypothetical protein